MNEKKERLWCCLPREMTDFQQEVAAKYIATKFKTKELRRRQSLIMKQIELAANVKNQEQWQIDRDSFMRNGMKNLQVMEKVYGRAVEISEFE